MCIWSGKTSKSPQNSISFPLHSLSTPHSLYNIRVQNNFTYRCHKGALNSYGIPSGMGEEACNLPFHVWWFSCYESIPFWNLLRCQYLAGSVETVQLELVKHHQTNLLAMLSFLLLSWMLSLVLGQGTSPGELYPTKSNIVVSLLHQILGMRYWEIHTWQTRVVSRPTRKIPVGKAQRKSRLLF